MKKKIQPDDRGLLPRGAAAPAAAPAPAKAKVKPEPKPEPKPEVQPEPAAPVETAPEF